MENFLKYLPLCKKMIIATIKWGCVGHLVVEHVGELVLISGSSMEPTLHNKDLLIASHLSQVKKLMYNDIVLARSITDPKKLVCKRVTALEGDVVLSHRGYLIVPRGHAWLLGDNRDNSYDSRYYGPVPLACIKGRIVCRLWPFSRACLFI